MVKLHHLRPPQGARRDRRRVGRGRAAGQGKTAGRGTKGYLARNPKRIGYEGGQLPLSRRLPKKKGFTNRNRQEWAVVNVERLGRRFKKGATVSPETLREAGLIRGRLPVKVLGRGDLDRSLTVRAHAFSATARQKIEQAGGRVEVLGD
ncbi:MAG TPA: 50S ribosomal protein L15 [Actinomycetota bacterium]|jgi:large subunit ribosomal protein L15|nr:50S ribosomal protein L15 [Actinomycetota bacterium]